MLILYMSHTYYIVIHADFNAILYVMLMMICAYYSIFRELFISFHAILPCFYYSIIIDDDDARLKMLPIFRLSHCRLALG